MRKLFAVFFMALASIGCSPTTTAPEAAAEIMSLINRGKFEKSWDHVAPQSKEAIEQQLLRNQSSAAGRDLVTDWLEISRQKLLSLSPKEYYVLIMTKAYDPDSPDTEIKSISEGAEVTLIEWEKGTITGTSTMIKTNGQWMILFDSVE